MHLPFRSKRALRAVAVAAMVGMTALGLAACSSGSNQASSGSATKGTLNWWGWTPTNSQEAKDFIADGQIEVGGATPVNTNGGLLGEAYIHGMNNLIEGVRQLRGESCNQVADARHVLVAAGRSAVILERA